MKKKNYLKDYLKSIPEWQMDSEYYTVPESMLLLVFSTAFYQDMVDNKIDAPTAEEFVSLVDKEKYLMTDITDNLTWDALEVIEDSLFIIVNVFIIYDKVNINKMVELIVYALHDAAVEYLQANFDIKEGWANHEEL